MGKLRFVDPDTGNWSPSLLYPRAAVYEARLYVNYTPTVLPQLQVFYPSLSGAANSPGPVLTLPFLGTSAVNGTWAFANAVFVPSGPIASFRVELAYSGA